MYQKYKKNKVDIKVYEDKFNKRVRLDEYSGGDPAEVISCLEQHLPVWTEKIIVKILAGHLPFFISRGFLCEGFIRGYFGGQDMYFLVKYISPERANSMDWPLGQTIMEEIISTDIRPQNELELDIIIATPKDARGLANLFSEVFPLYPTPLSDPTHIEKTMMTGTVYAYITDQEKILSAASAEIDNKFKNAELTDCATLESARGHGYMSQLIIRLEMLLHEMEIYCTYTIARSQSYGINKVFFNLGYTFGGRLINNCNIWSGLEDMNVWYKYQKKRIPDGK